MRRDAVRRLKPVSREDWGILPPYFQHLSMISKGYAARSGQTSYEVWIAGVR